MRGTDTDLTHQSFRLDDNLELQTNFNEQALAALVAKIITSTGPFYQGGNYIVPIARPIADKIKALLPIISGGSNSEQAIELHHKWADLNCLIGTQAGATERFKTAISTYQNILKEWTQGKAPLNWAMTQNNLGTALSTLGQRGDDDALKNAITAYENVI